MQEQKAELRKCVAEKGKRGCCIVRVRNQVYFVGCQKLMKILG